MLQFLTELRRQLQPAECGLKGWLRRLVALAGGGIAAPGAGGPAPYPVGRDARLTLPRSSESGVARPPTPHQVANRSPSGLPISTNPTPPLRAAGSPRR